MLSARTLWPLVTVLAICACATPPQGAPFLVLPGTGKDPAAFQQDDQICRQHAVAHTGYDAPSHDVVPGATGGAVIKATPGGESAPSLSPTDETGAANIPSDASLPDELGYLQCMAARGNNVRQAPAGDDGLAGDAWYPYGFGYQGAYPVFFGGFYGGWGWGGRHGDGWRGRGWHGGGWHGGAWHGGGGWHGGGHSGGHGGGHR